MTSNRRALWAILLTALLVLILVVAIVLVRRHDADFLSNNLNGLAYPWLPDRISSP